MRITMTAISLVRPEYCPSGIRKWFKACGFTPVEFRDFMRNGIEEAEFVQRGDWRATDIAQRIRDNG